MTNLTSRFDNSYCFTTFKKNESSIDIFCFMISVKVLRTLTFGMIVKSNSKNTWYSCVHLIAILVGVSYL